MCSDPTPGEEIPPPDSGPPSELAPANPDWSSTPEMGSSGWTRRFGGREWRFDAQGVYLRGAEGHESGGGNSGGWAPERTPGTPVTATAICTSFGASLVEQSRRWEVPPEILVMVLATEAGSFRRVGFTGPLTFRWEPGAKVRDVEPAYWGDYSFGPMQTLAGTARRITRVQGLDHDPFEVFPALRERPNLAPEALPGYEPEVSIEVGAAFMANAWDRTGGDPILVAANYNAGGLYDASSPGARLHNPWHLRTYGNHLDRAARWFGDACAVIGQLRRGA